MKLELVDIPGHGYFAKDDAGVMRAVTDWKIVGNNALIFTVAGVRDIFAISDAYDEDDGEIKDIAEYTGMEASKMNCSQHSVISVGNRSFRLFERYFIGEA